MPSLLIDIAANIAKLQTDVASAQKTMVGFAREVEGAFSKLGAVAAFAGVSIGLKEIVESAVKAQQAAESFKIIGTSLGYTTERLEEFKQRMDEAAAGTVDDSDMMQKAVKGMMLGLSDDQLVNIMEAARRAARATGEDVKDAYEKITDAISMGMPKALRQYGLVSKEEAAIVEKALREGVEGVDLYTMAMANASIQAAKFGELQTSNAEKLQKFKAEVGSIAEMIGVGLVNAYNVSFGSVEDRAAAALELVKGASDEMKKVNAADRDDAELGIAMSERAKAATLEEIKAKTGLKNVIEEQTKSLEALGKVMSKWGEDQLKLGKDDFLEKLKAENATLEEMTKATRSYLSTIKEVYAARINGENAVAEAMAKSGAKPKDVLEAQLEVLKIEKEGVLARLEVWKSYYEQLAAQHEKATNQMKDKTAELAKWEETVAAQRRSAVDQQIGLQEKLLASQGKMADSVEVYNLRQRQSEELYRKALSATGEESIRIWEEYKKVVATMTDKTVEYSKARDIWSNNYITTQKTIKSQEDNIKDALEKTADADRHIADAQDDITRARENEIKKIGEWKEELSVAMQSARTEMDGYKQQIVELSQTIANMEKKIALTVDTSQATAAVTAFKAMWDGIQSKTITLTTIMSGGSGGGYSGGDEGGYPGPDSIDFSDDIDIPVGPMTEGGYGSHAGGIPYIPTDNYWARLHEGERVLSKAENMRGGGGFTWKGNVVINGASKSGEQLADEIIRPLMRKLRQVNARVN